MDAVSNADDGSLSTRYVRRLSRPDVRQAAELGLIGFGDL